MTNKKKDPQDTQGKATPVFNNSAQSIDSLLARLEKNLPSLHDTLKIDGEEMTPTKKQREIIRLAKCKSIVFVNGALGTGKTFWACYAALEGLAEGRFKRISLTAPAVEADENLGFIPGDKDEKMEGHVLQILESIDELITRQLRKEMQEAGLIEIAPHAFNRGRTYKGTAYLLDECQNASARQLMTSIGRLGKESLFIYMGDSRQNDRTASAAAYDAFMDRFTADRYKDYIGRVDMGKEDVKRHPLLTAIIANDDDRPLEGYEDRNDSKIAKVTAAAPARSAP